MCYFYTLLIEKLGSRTKSFQQIDRLVQVIAVMLSESAAEVRNQGKVAILKL